MPHSASSLPPNYRHSRLTVVRRGCDWSRLAEGVEIDLFLRHRHELHCGESCLLLRLLNGLELFKPQTGNVGGRGALPSRSLGGSRGPFSHVREWPPYCALPHAAGEPKTQPLRAAPPSAPAGCPKPRLRAYVASAEPRSALKSGRNALLSHPSSQRRRTLSPSFTSKVKTTASSVCALTR